MFYSYYSPSYYSYVPRTRRVHAIYVTCSEKRALKWYYAYDKIRAIFSEQVTYNGDEEIVLELFAHAPYG